MVRSMHHFIITERLNIIFLFVSLAFNDGVGATVSSIRLSFFSYLQFIALDSILRELITNIGRIGTIAKCYRDGIHR